MSQDRVFIPSKPGVGVLGPPLPSLQHLPPGVAGLLLPTTTPGQESQPPPGTKGVGLALRLSGCHAASWVSALLPPLQLGPGWWLRASGPRQLGPPHAHPGTGSCFLDCMTLRCLSPGARPRPRDVHRGKTRFFCHLFSINKQLSSIRRLVPASPTGLGRRGLSRAEGKVGCRGGWKSERDPRVYKQKTVGERRGRGRLCHSSGRRCVTIRVGKEGQRDWLLPSFIFWILQVVPSNELEELVEQNDWK